MTEERLIWFRKHWVDTDHEHDELMGYIDQLRAELAAAKARIQKLEGALRFYAQKPQPDIKTAFAKSAEEWGVGTLTWEPMTDLGEIAREALKP